LLHSVESTGPLHFASRWSVENYRGARAS
jgi:hypothetical protein